MKVEFLVAGLAVVMFATGDAFAAAWGKSGRWTWFAAMLVAGTAAWVLFAYLNKTVPLASASAIVNLGLVLTSLAVSVWVFGERLLPLEKAGIAVGLVALGLFAAARMSAPPHPPGAAHLSEPSSVVAAPRDPL